MDETPGSYQFSLRLRTHPSFSFINLNNSELEVVEQGNLLQGCEREEEEGGAMGVEETGPREELGSVDQTAVLIYCLHSGVF